jgi:hypothetical protein
MHPSPARSSTSRAPSSSWPSWLFALLLAGCGAEPDGTASPSSSTSYDASAVDVLTADVPTADVPTADVRTADVRTADVLTADVLLADVLTADAPPDAPDADGPACGPPSYACPTGYRCVGLSTLRCVRTAALGEPCSNGGDNPIYCPLSATCERVGGIDRCVAIGALNGLCQNSSACIDLCAPGLGCDRSDHCRPGLAPGALCGGDTDFCNEGSSCITTDGTARCVADGTAGGFCWRDHRCDAGLSCRGASTGGCNTSFHCTAGIPLDEPCTATGERCADGLICGLRGGAMRCVTAPDGAIGGRCRAVAPACDEGAECGDSGWRCVRRVARGVVCEPSGGATTCVDGDTCTTEHRADLGRCAAAGTAPGADCRTSGTPCDGELQCSDFSRYRRTCRVVAKAGAPCDLGAIATLCPSTTRCLPMTVDAQGTATSICAAPLVDGEPNERGVMRFPTRERSVLMQARFTDGDVEDCHALRMPAGSALYVESTLPMVASLLRASGVEVGRWTLTPVPWGGPLGGSARLDPASIGALRNLAADDYLLCVRPRADTATRPRPAEYLLGIGILPRSW